MQVYVYQADLWCARCGAEMVKELTQQGKAPPDPTDQTSYDSDHFPKVVHQAGEFDTVQHCAAGADCFDAIPLSKKLGKVGAWLENSLTTDGITWLKDKIRAEPNRPLLKLWREWYRDVLDEREVRS